MQAVLELGAKQAADTLRNAAKSNPRFGSSTRVETVTKVPGSGNGKNGFVNPARRLHSPIQGQENMIKALNGAENLQPSRLVN